MQNLNLLLFVQISESFFFLQFTKQMIEHFLSNWLWRFSQKTLKKWWLELLEFLTPKKFLSIFLIIFDTWKKSLDFFQISEN